MEIPYHVMIIVLLDLMLVSLVSGQRRRRPSHPLTPEEKDIILRLHNNARATVNPPASNMRRLKWSQELAVSAARYAQQCVFQHSRFRTHSRYRWVGENLYIRRGSRDLVRAIKRWENEKNHYDFSTESCTTRTCGHYTQMIWADTSEVGCEIVLCDVLVRPRRASWRRSYNLVCHYGPGGNVRGYKPYIPGRPCRSCPSSCSQNMCYR